MWADCLLGIYVELRLCRPESLKDRIFLYLHLRSVVRLVAAGSGLAVGAANGQISWKVLRLSDFEEAEIPHALTTVSLCEFFFVHQSSRRYFHV